MRATKRTIIVTLLALAALLCGTALAGGLGELKAIDLPFPPGERSVRVLLLAPDGRDIRGAVLSPAEGRLRLFRYDLQKKTITLAKVMPEPLGLAQDYVRGKAKAWAWDAHWASGYSLSANGALRLHKYEGTVEELGQVAGTRPFEPKGYQVSQAIFLDAEGNVYTAGKGGAIYRYSPATKKLEELKARLPAVKGREPWASLDAAVLGPDGLVYGGTFDGYLFTFDMETHQVVNLGKPFRQQRILGLAFSRGKLYGVGGEEEGLQRSFAFDPETRGFELGGTLKSDQDNLYDPVGAMVADEDGNIYLGITGRLGNVFVWEREEE